MKNSRQHQLHGLAANVHNPQAGALARAINRGGDAQHLVREAIVDAHIHSDWGGVTAIENSLENVRNRTIARKLLNVGGRALIVSRKDRSALAELIPEGFEFGLAWLLCMFFIRTDGDYRSGLAVGNAFHQEVKKEPGLDIYWGSRAMCVPTMSFGPPSRIMTTSSMCSGNPAILLHNQDSGSRYFEAQRAHAIGDIGSDPLAYMLWGCRVTGVRDINDLFIEQTWCPGLDAQTLNTRLAPLLSRAAQTIGGDTYIHPAVLPADEAYEMAQWISREQTIDAIVGNVLGDDAASSVARISLLEPTGLPYMDQVLVSFFNRAKMLRQTFRFPRSGNELEVDAEIIANIVKDRGVKTVELVNPVVGRGSNNVQSLTVSNDGQWVPTDIAGLGETERLILNIEWTELLDGERAPAGAHRLPSVLYVAQCGAAAAFGDHYKPNVWEAIKVALSSPGDPEDQIIEVCKREWTGDSEIIEWIIEHHLGLLLPSLEVALAVQFKCSNGAVVVAKDSLLQLLDHTDIGDDCPMTFLQAGFESMYLVIKVPAEALDVPDDSESRCFIDGILAQRWTEGETHHLLLNVFLVGNPDDPENAYPYEAVPIKLTWAEGDTLAEIRSQVEVADGLGQQTLDLYAGIVLYMNSKDARLIDQKDHTVAANALAGKNRKKRKKADYESLNGSVDALHVGPDEPMPPPTGAEGITKKGKGKKSHYRRGFVRVNQRCGKGRLEKRPVFIPPVLVNANKLVGALPAKKTYKIG